MIFLLKILFGLQLRVIVLIFGINRNCYKICISKLIIILYFNRVRVYYIVNSSWTRTQLNFPSICDFSSLMVHEDKGVPNWILDDIGVLSQKVAKNFTLLFSNVWIGEIWFGWMLCHQLKLWFFISFCMVICLLIWRFKKEEWFFAHSACMQS